MSNTPVLMQEMREAAILALGILLPEQAEVFKLKYGIEDSPPRTNHELMEMLRLSAGELYKRWAGARELLAESSHVEEFKALRPFIYPGQTEERRLEAMEEIKKICASDPNLAKGLEILALLYGIQESKRYSHNEVAARLDMRGGGCRVGNLASGTIENLKDNAEQRDLWNTLQPFLPSKWTRAPKLDRRYP